MRNQTDRLGSESVFKLLISLALPAVAAQLINVLYNIVDRIYIGNIANIGDVALTGVGVTMPIIMIISAFAAFAGMGGAPRASMKLGEGDHEGAEHILGNSVTILLFVSVVLTVLFSIYKEPLLYMFGASKNTIAYSLEYISIYIYGTIFVQIALGLNTFISAQGFASIAMKSVLLGAVTNIVLDPIFIFVFGMGVRGAALATVISQALSAAWILHFLIRGKGAMKIHLKNLIPNRAIIMGTVALGVSPFIMQATESLVNIVLNRGLQHYGGDIYIGTMTIIMSVMQLIVMPINGFTQGAQPIMSYNYGAKNYDRVRKCFKYLITITMSISTLWCIVVAMFPYIFARMFTPNAELIALTNKLMPIFFAGIWAFGAQLACQTTFLSLGQAKISLFLALLRKVFLLIPMAIVFPMVWGVDGMFFAEPLADMIAATTTVTMFIMQKNILLPKQSKV